MELFFFYLLNFHIIVLTMDMLVHRGYSHGYLKVSPGFEHVCRFILWTIRWGTWPQWLRMSAGTHRLHHKNSDSENDSHSPYHISLKGLFNANHNPYFKRVDPNTHLDHAPDVPIYDDWMQRNVYSKYPYGGIVLISLIYGMLFGWIGLVVAPMLMWFSDKVGLVLLSAWLPHKVGLYRHEGNKYPDRSFNMFPLGIYFGGMAELHSNHHVYPNRANVGIKWFEFDLFYWYARLFEKFGWLKFIDRKAD